MIKKLALIVLISASVFVSCKKKDTTPEPAPVAPVADGTPSSATKFNGIFTMGIYYTMMSSTSTNTSVSARAYFSDQRTEYINSSSAVKVDKVYLNGDTLSYSSFDKYYNLYNTVSLATETWSVIGANGIATFSFSPGLVTPSCTGAETMLDSISKSTGFSININNVSAVSEGRFMIFDDTGNITGSVIKSLSPGNNAITVTAAELAPLGLTSSGFMVVSLVNKKAFIFSSKDYQFTREYQFTKVIKIKA